MRSRAFRRRGPPSARQRRAETKIVANARPVRAAARLLAVAPVQAEGAATRISTATRWAAAARRLRWKTTTRSPVPTLPLAGAGDLRCFQDAHRLQRTCLIPHRRSVRPASFRQITNKGAGTPFVFAVPPSDLPTPNQVRSAWYRSRSGRAGTTPASSLLARDFRAGR